MSASSATARRALPLPGGTVTCSMRCISCSVRTTRISAESSEETADANRVAARVSPAIRSAQSGLPSVARASPLPRHHHEDERVHFGGPPQRRARAAASTRPGRHQAIAPAGVQRPGGASRQERSQEAVQARRSQTPRPPHRPPSRHPSTTGTLGRSRPSPSPGRRADLPLPGGPDACSARRDDARVRAELAQICDDLLVPAEKRVRGARLPRKALVLVVVLAVHGTITAACWSDRDAPFVRDCAAEAAGELGDGWEDRAVHAGPVAFVPLREHELASPKPRATLEPGRHIPKKVLVVLRAGLNATVSVATEDRQAVSLLYDPERVARSSPERGYIVEDGSPEVHFAACDDHPTYFNGAFVVSGPICLGLIVEVGGQEPREVLAPLEGGTCESNG